MRPFGETLMNLAASFWPMISGAGCVSLVIIILYILSLEFIILEAVSNRAPKLPIIIDYSKDRQTGINVFLHNLRSAFINADLP